MTELVNVKNTNIYAYLKYFCKRINKTNNRKKTMNIICEYCGTKYSDTLPNCPNCGAVNHCKTDSFISNNEKKSNNIIVVVGAIIATAIVIAIVCLFISFAPSSSGSVNYMVDVKNTADSTTPIENKNTEFKIYSAMEDDPDAYYGENSYSIEWDGEDFSISRPKGMLLDYCTENGDYPFICFRTPDWNMSVYYRISYEETIEDVVKSFTHEDQKVYKLDDGDKSCVYLQYLIDDDTNSCRIYQSVGKSTLLEISVFMENGEASESLIKSLLL